MDTDVKYHYCDFRDRRSHPTAVSLAAEALRLATLSATGLDDPGPILRAGTGRDVRWDDRMPRGGPER